MLKHLKKKLGNSKRALQGMLLNTFEKMPFPPNELKSQTIGRSTNGAPILAYQIGNGPKKVLYSAGIHGNEVGTVKLAHHILKWLHENPLQDFSLFVIPCLNPDGYKKAQEHPNYFGGGRIGRLNEKGVDLNRNFKVPSFQSQSFWCHGENYQEKTEVYCGEEAFSEPETKALRDFINKEKIKTIFMFHNAGADLISSEDLAAQKLANLYVEHTGFQLYSVEDWKKMQQNGTMLEWCMQEKISYIEIEGSTRWGSDWKKQRKALEATLL